MEWRFEEERQDSGMVGRLSLQGEMTISGMSSMKEAFQKGIDSSDMLVVDCAGVAAIDISGMQLLCSAHRSAVSLGKSLIAENLTEGQLSSSLDEAGFRRHKACPLAPKGEPCIWVAEPVE